MGYTIEEDIVRVYWNSEYQTYEALHEDGFIEPLRDGFDAKELAARCGLAVEEDE